MKTIKNKSFIILSTFVCLLPILMYVFVFDQLPEQMVQHWGAGGTPTWTMPREFAIFVLPLVLALIHLIVVFAIGVSAAKGEISAKFHAIILWFIPVTSIFVNLIVIFGNLNENFDVGTAALAFVGLTFIVMGNYLPQTRPNWYAGIRTYWTMNNADVWYRTHRLGGKLFIFAGILLLLGAALPLSESIFTGLFLLAIVLAVVVPIVYSYVLYKRL